MLIDSAAGMISVITAVVPFHLIIYGLSIHLCGVPFFFTSRPQKKRLCVTLLQMSHREPVTFSHTHSNVYVCAFATIVAARKKSASSSFFLMRTKKEGSPAKAGLPLVCAEYWRALLFVTLWQCSPSRNFPSSAPLRQTHRFWCVRRSPGSQTPRQSQPHL